MQEAIKRAIEGGYGKVPNPNLALTGDDRVAWYASNGVLLDPLFWQALGKAEGWSDKKVCAVCNGEKTHWIQEWHYRWSRFIDHIAEGKSPDQFFEELLSELKKWTYERFNGRI